MFNNEFCSIVFDSINNETSKEELNSKFFVLLRYSRLSCLSEEDLGDIGNLMQYIDTLMYD